MPRVTVKAQLGKRSDKVQTAVRKALAASNECVLVVYGQNAANIYYEGAANGPGPGPVHGHGHEEAQSS